MRKYALILSIVLAACAMPLNAKTPTVYKDLDQLDFRPIDTTFVVPMPSPTLRKVKQTPHVKVIKPIRSIPSMKWVTDPEISWYGPGLFGNGMACGHKLTKQTLGVAHKTLPCGTRVTFSYKGRTITVRVVDRGPYVSGRIFDLTAGTCRYLHHCFTGPIRYHILKGN